jgi:type I restriction enzyme, R subunit
VGLTATPKDEVDRNTYGLFELENGVPTDEYALEDAVREKWLVPPVPISLQMQFPREGIVYNDLSDEEKEEWDTLEWPEDGGVPRFEALKESVIAIASALTEKQATL